MPEIAADVESNDLGGARRLAGAVLTQAIEDIHSGAGKRRADALGWILDSRDGTFSFVFYCRILNRHPEDVRRFLVRQNVPDSAVPARLMPSPGNPA